MPTQTTPIPQPPVIVTSGSDLVLQLLQEHAPELLEDSKKGLLQVIQADTPEQRKARAVRYAQLMNALQTALQQVDTEQQESIKEYWRNMLGWMEEGVQSVDTKVMNQLVKDMESVSSAAA